MTRKKFNIIRSSARWVNCNGAAVVACVLLCCLLYACDELLHWFVQSSLVFLCVLHWLCACVCFCVLHWCAGHTGVCDCAWELLDSHEKLHALKHTSPSRSGAKCLAFVERKENLVCNILPFIPGAVKLIRKRYIWATTKYSLGCFCHLKVKL